MGYSVATNESNISPLHVEPKYIVMEKSDFHLFSYTPISGFSYIFLKTSLMI